MFNKYGIVLQMLCCIIDYQQRIIQEVSLKNNIGPIH